MPCAHPKDFGLELSDGECLACYLQPEPAPKHPVRRRGERHAMSSLYHDERAADYDGDCDPYSSGVDPLDVAWRDVS